MVQMNVGDRNVQLHGILFDKDGTLLPFLHLWGCWAERVLSGLQQEFKQRDGEFRTQLSSLLGVYTDKDSRVYGYDRQGPLAMGSPSQIIGIGAYFLYKEDVPWNEAVRRIYNGVRICQYSAAGTFAHRANRRCRSVFGA